MTHVLTALLGEVYAITGLDDLDCNTLWKVCKFVLTAVRRDPDHGVLMVRLL